ncbi:MAG: Lpg1974 family pore-forming outer membrane protein [Pirellulaceae bacterium]|nr:hypothetical protein [Planctomycetales bacterium]
MADARSQIIQQPRTQQFSANRVSPSPVFAQGTGVPYNQVAALGMAPVSGQVGFAGGAPAVNGPMAPVVYADAMGGYGRVVPAGTGVAPVVGSSDPNLIEAPTGSGLAEPPIASPPLSGPPMMAPIVPPSSAPMSSVVPNPPISAPPMAPILSPSEAQTYPTPAMPTPVATTLPPTVGNGCAGGSCDTDRAQWGQYLATCGEGGCTDLSCTSFLGGCTDMPCLDCGGSGCMVCQPCCERVRAWGEFLYLRPRNAEVAYAVPIDGPIAPTLGNGIQIGRTSLVDINHNAGFRVGMALSLNDCSRIWAQFTNYESNIDDRATVNSPDVLRSLVTHPLGDNVATDASQALASYDINFELVDLAFTGILKNCNCWLWEYTLGVRYGKLDQLFRSSFIEADGITNVLTDLGFNGTGPRLGMNLTRNVGCHGLYLYTRGDSSFLVGKSVANYSQSDSFRQTVVANSWQSGRILTQLDLEAGFGWSSCSQRFSISAGYLVSAWLNAVKTDEYIQSVQTNQFLSLGDGLTFDGLALRTELRF